ncbi:MAG TPA: hypothetical protein VII11_08310 [Bacteroidota bacterium]
MSVNFQTVSPRYVVAIALMMVKGPCDESLPPYTEPEEFLGGRISGVYALSASSNALFVFLTVVNEFDETLQDRVLFRGSIEIASARNPSIRKTIDLNAANLSFSLSSFNEYDRNSRLLTIDPGDSLVFVAAWDFTSDDNGVDLRRDLFVFFQDATCPGRCLARQEDFVLSGEITIFNERAPVLGKTLFPVCFVSGFSPPNACPPIITSPPCANRPVESARCYPF